MGFTPRGRRPKRARYTEVHNHQLQQLSAIGLEHSALAAALSRLETAIYPEVAAACGAGIAQADIADAIGFSQQTISKIVRDGVPAQAPEPDAPAELPAASSSNRILGEARAGLGLTLSEVGAKVGVSKQTVQNWENGLNYPSLRFLPALTEMLLISPHQILAKGNGFQ